MKVRRVPLGFGTFGYARKVKPREGFGFCHRCGKGPCKLKPHPCGGLVEGAPRPARFCASCEGILCAPEPATDQVARTLPARQARQDVSKRLGGLRPNDCDSDVEKPPQGSGES